MARIVIDARESGTTTGRYVDKLIEYLAKLKPDYEVIILTKSQRLEFIKRVAPAFKTVRADYKEFSFFGEQLGLAWRLYRLRPDLVHFSMTQQPVLYFGKSVTTVHDLTTARFRNPTKNRLAFWLKQWVYRAVIIWVAHKSRRITAPTRWVKDALVGFAHINAGKVIVTYESADKITGAAEPIAGVIPGGFIAYVGRPLPHKNLKRLINAFALLKSDHPDLRLVIASKKDKLVEDLEKYTLAKNFSGVIFPGFISEGQLRWLYENAAAYVFPSLSEGFGLPGLEAMLAGAPVVSSNDTCLPEIYGEAVIYFDPKDVDDMAVKIARVLDDENLCQKLVVKGKEQAAKYSWQRMAQQTLDIYRQVLETSPAGKQPNNNQ